MSSARRISDVMTSRPSLLAAVWASPISTGAGLLTLANIASRRRPGTTSRKSSIFLPARSACWFDSPVTLPPGRTRLATRPLPMGSVAISKTIGMSDVTCFAAAAAAPDATMTSTLSWTNSVAISAKRSVRPRPTDTRSQRCDPRSSRVHASAVRKQRSFGSGPQLWSRPGTRRSVASRLLRVGRKWPCRSRDAEDDEFATPHGRFPHVEYRKLPRC